jgi:GTP-binding protein
MTFRVNDGPFAARRQYVTSRQIGERLEKELQHNVALRVAPEKRRRIFGFRRGLMHLGILLEICVAKVMKFASASRKLF